MKNVREKGKIPVGERPRILARYAAGEKLAQIARDYRCTPAAIRYIVNRSRARADNVANAGAAHVDEGGQQSTRQLASAALPVPGRRATTSGRDASTRSIGRPGLLDSELYTRVTGDAVTFLAALDQTASEGSIESLEGLREAIEKLMRSVARTSLEIGRVLNSGNFARVAAGRALVIGN